MPDEENQNETFHFHPNENGDFPKDVVIRKGDAPEPEGIERDPVRFSGQIDAPWIFLKHLIDNELIERKTAICYVDYGEGQIVLDDNMIDQYKNQVIGKIVLSKEVTEWPINQNVNFSPRELAQKIKFKRMDFTDRETAMRLVSKLNNFSAKFSGSVSDTDDQRGNQEKHFKEQLEHDVDEGFTLSIPILENREDENVPVQIGVYQEKGDVKLWLESPELKERLETIRKQELNEQVQKIQDLGVCVLSR